MQRPFFQAGRPSASLHSYALADKMIEKVRSVTPNPKPFRSARATHTGVQDPGALINKSHCLGGLDQHTINSMTVQASIMAIRIAIFIPMHAICLPFPFPVLYLINQQSLTVSPCDEHTTAYSAAGGSAEPHGYGSGPGPQ
jgi:hypothetical protein